MPHRLLFASIHSYLDPSSGAALGTRELLELLAARGWDCRVLTCGVLDYQNETPLEDVLASIERPTSRVGASLSRGGEAEVFDLELDGVRLTLLPTAFSRAERAPSAREAALFLDLADQVLARFRPEILLTYGGHPASRELMRRARAHGTAVVFHLHNFGYNDRRGLEDVDAFIVPSEYSRRHYARRVGLDGTGIPYAIQLRKIVSRDS
jgi:Glycosyl transferase 4-like domain